MSCGVPRMTRLLRAAQGEEGLAGLSGAQAFKETLTFVPRRVHRVEQDIKVVSELFCEYGDHLLGQGVLQPLPIDQDQAPFRCLGTALPSMSSQSRGTTAGSAVKSAAASLSTKSARPR